MASWMDFIHHVKFSQGLNSLNEIWAQLREGLEGTLGRIRGYERQFFNSHDMAISWVPLVFGFDEIFLCGFLILKKR